MKRLLLAVFVLFFCLPGFAATRTWTGAVSANWSDPNNWSPAGVPAAADSLAFGSAARTSMVNDLPAGTSFGPMSFSAPFSLSGNALTLTGSISGTGLSCSANLKAGASPLTIAGNAFTGAIDVNGNALTLDGVTSVAALNGSGTINIHQPFPYNTTISGSGTFTGAITGGDVHLYNVSLPNAAFSLELLYGSGTTGPVSINQVGSTYSEFTPSDCNAPLSTGSLAVNSVVKIPLCPGVGSAHVHVTGSVTIGAQATLQPFVFSGAPTVGQTFTVIDNDGTDPINGTFSGLPEGATVSTGMGNARITYRGGDGNDVTLTITSVTKNWTGAVSNNWSDPNNWSPAGIPTVNDTLLFPGSGTPRTMNDDLPPGTSVGPMIFGFGPYTLNGNPLTLTGSVSGTAGYTISNDLKIGAPLTMDDVVLLSGAVDVNGQALTLQTVLEIKTLNGTGTVTTQDPYGPAISGSGNFSGTISGGLYLDGGSLPNATLTGGALGGAGTIGPATVGGSYAVYASGLRPLATSCCAVINSGSLVLNGPLVTKLYSGGLADKIHVTGSVTFGAGAQLQFSFPTGPSVPGDEFVIIENDGNDAVNGMIGGYADAGVYEGSPAPWPWGVTYKGGDGNDVAIFHAARTITTATQSSPTSRYGEPVTFTATITGEIPGPPTGHVTFYDSPRTIIAVQNGSATWTTSSLPVGTTAIPAYFVGDAPWFYSYAASLSHVVLPSDTTTTLSVTNPSITYGDTAHVTANVGVVAPGAGTPTGTLSLLVDGAVVRTATVTGGAIAFDLPLLAGGTHAISVAYSGDGNFNPSTSAAAQEVVAVAPTTLTASATPDPVYEGEGVGIVVAVRAASSGLTPSGTVTASQGGRTVAAQTLTNGAATLTIGALPVGEQTIVVAYAGGTNFQSASTALKITVLPPAIVASDVTTSGDAPHTLTIPLTLSAPISLPASIDFATADGTARAGSAYVAAHGSATFPAGTTSASISVDITGNPSAAPLTFAVRLSNPVNASLSSPAITVAITGSGVATTYTFAPGLSLDLYAPSTPVAGGAPLILAIPGTSAYDSAQGAIAALRETARGYAVARVAYRVAPFPAQLNDLTAAVGWIRANASTLNVDPNRIGAWGYGTGAHLAALLGTSDAHLAAVVETSGATDLPDLNADALACSTVDHNSATSVESQLLGCAIPACSAVALDASPLHRVTSSSAPTLIIHGATDCVIGPQQAMRLFDALRHAGVYTLLRIVPGAGHDDVTGSAATAGEIDAFLDVHLKLGGARPRPSHH